MQEEIKNILSDLYKIDENLKQYETDLLDIIKTFLEVKPDIRLDENFQENLKKEIMKKINEIKQEQVARDSSLNNIVEKKPLFLSLRFAYFLGGAGLAALVMFVVFQNVLPAGKAEKVPFFGLNKSSIALAPNAFGKLSAENTKVENRGMGAGNAVSSESAPKALSADAGFVPRMTNYEYVYTGGEFVLDREKVEVLRRIKSKETAKNFSGILKSAKISLLDLSKFTDTELSDISLKEDREFGFTYWFNPLEGISVGSNWEKWPHPDQDCRDDACYSALRLKESDLPSDEDLIALADAFASHYGIDMGNYGKGRVLAFWRDQENIPENERYIPEDVQVLYPLIINDQEVFDNSGEKVGLSITVNVRYKRPSGAYQITANNFESSEYEAVTNNKDVLDLANKGGMQYWYRYESADESVKIELDTPSFSYVKHYNYAGGAQSDELYIPALIFPVKINQDLKNGFYQKNVIVPLAKEFFDNFVKEKNQDQPMPILMEGARTALPAESIGTEASSSLDSKTLKPALE